MLKCLAAQGPQQRLQTKMMIKKGLICVFVTSIARSSSSVAVLLRAERTWMH